MHDDHYKGISIEQEIEDSIIERYLQRVEDEKQQAEDEKESNKISFKSFIARIFLIKQ